MLQDWRPFVGDKSLVSYWPAAMIKGSPMTIGQRIHAWFSGTRGLYACLNKPDEDTLKMVDAATGYAQNFRDEDAPLVCFF